jgi:hypothetical protein
MKKFVLQFSITPNDDEVSIEDLKKTISHLGSTCFTVSQEVECIDTSELDLPNTAWIFVSADDSEPFIVVPKAFESEGEEIAPEDLEFFQREGVVTELHALYPRADRYDAPGYASDKDLADCYVADYGFRVPASGVEVFASDSRDDSVQTVWLKVALPEREKVSLEKEQGGFRLI